MSSEVIMFGLALKKGYAASIFFLKGRTNENDLPRQQRNDSGGPGSS
jgi:hypothetical protein